MKTLVALLEKLMDHLWVRPWVTFLALSIAMGVAGWIWAYRENKEHKQTLRDWHASDEKKNHEIQKAQQETIAAQSAAIIALSTTRANHNDTTK